MDSEIISKLEKEVQRTYSIKTTVFQNGEKVSEEINTHREPCVRISIEMADKILALLKEQEAVEPINMENDIVYGLSEISLYLSNIGKEDFAQTIDDACKKLELLKEQEADKNKYEYKYDHTDCLWYGSGDCPSTCSQYRDGWNDAMDYIFKDGKGYQPYRRLVKRE